MTNLFLYVIILCTLGGDCMKVYFKYEPNNFSIYDNIDKYGDLSFKHASSFDVSEEDNYIIFVGNAIKLFGKTIYFSGIR